MTILAFSRLDLRRVKVSRGHRSGAWMVAVWLLAAVAASVFLPSAAHMEAPNPAALPSNAPSATAAALQRKAFGGGGQVPGLVVLYRRGGLTFADDARAAALMASLAQTPLPAQAGKPPLASLPAGTLRSMEAAKGTTLVLPVAFRAARLNQDAGALIAALSGRIRQAWGYDALSRPPSSGALIVRLTGPVGIAADAATAFKNADVTLLIATTVLILVLLVLIYRSPVLPFLPLLGVGFAYVIASGVLGAMARAGWLVLDAQTVSIMTVLMFGAGTDYTLFLVARCREHLDQGMDAGAAVGAALRESGPAIAMSAATVALAMLCLLVAREGSDHRFAIPYAVGVLATAAASLTLVPALVAVAGRRAFWPYRQPQARVGRGTEARSESAIARLAARRPWIVAGVSLALLGALASAAPGIRTTYDLLSALPASSQARQGETLVARADGPGSLAPATVLVEGRAAKGIAAALRTVPGVAAVSAPKHGRADGRTVTAYTVTLRADPMSTAAMAAVVPLRQAAERALASSGDRGSTVFVAGETAQNRDEARLTAQDTRRVLPLVLALIAVLLLVFLRSAVAAAYLIATVVLSFFASLGLGWLVLHDILGIQAWSGGVVLLAFVFLVALGEDYNLFMVSRIWQERRERPMVEAVVRGASATGPVITAAGVILAGTFAVLTALPIAVLLEFGVVAALGVLLDTLLVRSALVPAITAILGDRALWPHRPEPKPGEAPTTAAP